MLKGKSKIELFDAATGAKLLEQRDSNMVTNALDTIINCKDKLGLLKWWRETVVSPDVTEHIIVSPGFAMMPLYKRALGGVLLWDSNITEDPSIVIPPSKVKEVGHAGNAYSGTDVYRGSYNDNESGEIDGGWRHVWDFDTDKANGTVKCLSLTSRHGGNIGYHSCFEGDLYPLYNHCYFHSENKYTPASSIHAVSIAQDSEKGAVIHIKSMGDGTLRVYKKSFTNVWYLKVPDPNKVTLLSDQLTYTEKVPLFTISDQRAAIYVYKGQIHEISQLSTTQLQHRIFSLEGAQISSRTISLPFSFRSTTYYNPAFFRDDYYYCVPRNDTDMIKLDSQGQEVGRIALLTNYMDQVRTISINDYNGDVILGLKLNSTSVDSFYTSYVLDSSDEVHAVSYGNNGCVTNLSTSTSIPYSQYINMEDPNSPFIYFSNADNGDIIPLVNTGYLATINNLKAPIVKTPAQTMKITYEIYDE